MIVKVRFEKDNIKLSYGEHVYTIFSKDMTVAWASASLHIANLNLQDGDEVVYTSSVNKFIANSDYVFVPVKVVEGEAKESSWDDYDFRLLKKMENESKDQEAVS